MILCYFLLVLTEVTAVIAATVSIIHMQNCVSDVVKNWNVKGSIYCWELMKQDT